MNAADTPASPGASKLLGRVRERIRGKNCSFCAETQYAQWICHRVCQKRLLARLWALGLTEEGQNTVPDGVCKPVRNVWTLWQAQNIAAGLQTPPRLAATTFLLHPYSRPCRATRKGR